ncbi:hypothetical protein [Actinomadura nitritigenes]|uniref:hypothetical protein n=1 Tax=Actinomadura nitritigenes TaxID=134602 RepID=UPI003D8E1E63
MLTTEPADFIDVADLKAYMKKAAGTADDDELADFVATACEMIRERIGEVSPVTAVVEACPRGGIIVLEHRPVISITTVAELPGGDVVPPADEVAGTAGWVLDGKDAGLLRYTGCWPRRVRVTYEAGRDPIPANIVQAAKELAAHLWRGPKLNAGGGRPTLNGDSATMIGSTFALPIRVRELLGLGARVPHDEILVG